MPESLDLIDETLTHFNEGAKSVRAYTNNNTYVITRIHDSNEFWIAIENEGFTKKKLSSLDEYFKEVFGIEANY